MARKPSAVARELLRNLPKGSGKKRRRRNKRSREVADAKEAPDNGLEAEAGGEEEELEPDAGPMPGTAEDPGEDDPVADATDEDDDDLEPASPPVSASDPAKPAGEPEWKPTVPGCSSRRRRRRRAA